MDMGTSSVLVSPTARLKGWFPEYTILPSGALRLESMAPEDTFIFPVFEMVRGIVLVPLLKASVL